MVRSLAVVAICSGLLAAFCIAQMQFFGLIFDHYFALVVPGMITVAGCLALAVYNKRNKKFLPADSEWGAVSWVALVPLMASGTLIVPFSLPLGSVVVFLLVTALLLPPFFCWAYGVRLLAGQGKKLNKALSVALLSGLVIGLLVTPWMIEYAGSPVRLGWMIAAALGVAVLLLAGKESLLFAGTVFLVVSGLALTQLNVSRNMLPHWAPGHQTQLKPVLGEMARGKSMRGIAVSWDAAGRTDVVTINNDKNQALGWVLTNGTSPVAMQISGKDKPLSWWREQFPIVSVPFEISNPGRMLSIGAFPGPEVRIAEKMNRKDIHVASFNNSSSDFLALIPDESLDRRLEQVSELHTGNPRSILRDDDARHAMIFMPITQPGWYGWFGSNPEEGYLYTVEAIQEYLWRLERDGMLVITTREEVLFVRALLTAWEALEGESGRSIKIERHVIGVRLASKAPNRGGYQNLLMIFKDGIPTDVKAGLHKVTGNPNVELLFGAGNKPVRPYTVLSHSGGLEIAKQAMKRIYSRRYKVIVDLEATTDMRPGFFQVLRELHPFLKWLFTLSLAVLIGSLLFPLSSLRRIDNADSAGKPPMPVLLGYFLLPSAGLAMIVAGQMQFASILPVIAMNGTSVLLAMLVAGLGAGLLVADYALRQGKGKWLQWFPLVLVFPAYLAGGLMTSVAEVAAAWTGWQQTFFMISIPALTGLVAGLQLLYGMRKLVEYFDDLVFWAWIVIGTAVLAGTILAFWMAQLWGWNLVWIVAGSSFLLSVGIGFWAWSPSQDNRCQVTA